MDSELASAALIAGYWQATAVVIGVVVLASGAFSLVSLWAGRHIDAKFDKHAAATDAKFDAMDAKLDKHAAATDAKFDAMDAKLDKHAAATAAMFEKFAAATDAKFDKHAAAMEAHRREVEAAIARGTKEHEDWRVEMKAINEKVTDLLIDREVERRMQASRGDARAAGSDDANA